MAKDFSAKDGFLQLLKKKSDCAKILE